MDVVLVDALAGVNGEHYSTYHGERRVIATDKHPIWPNRWSVTARVLVKDSTAYYPTREFIFGR